MTTMIDEIRSTTPQQSALDNHAMYDANITLTGTFLSASSLDNFYTPSLKKCSTRFHSKRSTELAPTLSFPSSSRPVDTKCAMSGIA